MRRRTDRAAPVQPDVQDLHGAGRRCSATVYLRPETAQGMFVNFQNVVNSTRKKLPFGIAQIGKSFRNEITTGNFIFRDREFEQMEIEFFIKPGTQDKWFEYWINERINWWQKLGMRKEHLKFRQHCKEELAHYALGCFDINFRFPMGWSELEGIASRGDYDLTQHADCSGKNLQYNDEETKSTICPTSSSPPPASTGVCWLSSATPMMRMSRMASSG